MFHFLAKLYLGETVYRVILIFLIAVVSGCLQVTHKIDQLWFYSYSSNTGDTDNAITPANFLSLQSDGSYTRDFGKFEEGTWREENSILYLKSKRGIIEFPIKSHSANELLLQSEKGTILHFESVARNFSTSSDDPFTTANNRWRIAPEKKENEEELKSRLKNHFRFYELYFEWALNNHSESIDVNSTPSPLKIYGNGFALKSFEELPVTWRSYFFDEDDCKHANEMIEAIFKKREISWPKTENKFKMFISAFQQLQQQVQ